MLRIKASIHCKQFLEFVFENTNQLCVTCSRKEVSRICVQYMQP